ncbi:CD225/dispanin family protein [Nocardiopsis alborubida]|uniref:CD225/dispanin family protein n=1 Tax=Nocardiopsis alborubida TaxID=146802 RepID=A0A7X6MCE2_9ACTN|nr:CD225/dispanin family protein [Nocardiopsis alborubida]NKY98616.1 CD225/dispanin family protein [Nocardiopsis alborubida]
MSYGPPHAGGYGPPGGYGYYAPPPGGPPRNYLVFNILGIVSCIPLIGVIGLVFALQVNSKWETGDYMGAQSASDTAKVLGIIGLVCFVPAALYLLVVLVYFLFMFAMLAAM